MARMPDRNCQPLIVITCGGTFDLVPEAHRGVFNSPSLARRILSDIAVTQPEPLFLELFAKDSEDMTEADRTMLADCISQAVGDRIVVVHGTDTLVASVDAVADRGLKKTVVFTGAFVPAAHLNSDAAGNLGGAIIAARLLPHGVYVSLHGDVFAAGTFRKNRELKRFELL